MGTVAMRLDEGLVALLRQPNRSVEDGGRELIVTNLYWRGAISRGRAAELLGRSLDTFLRYVGKLGIPYVNVTEDEWEAEKRVMREIATTLPPPATQAR